MLSHLLKTGLKARSLLTRAPMALTATQKRFYYPDNVLMQRSEGDYFADPKVVAERAIRLIALHDNVKDPSAITL